MKKRTVLLSLAAALAASAAALVLLRQEEPEDEPEEESTAEKKDVPVADGRVIAFPLKNKYADYSHGEGEPTYRFELDTPDGVKEVEVTQAHYDTYYIGDEVLCLETDKGPVIV